MRLNFLRNQKREKERRKRERESESRSVSDDARIMLEWWRETNVEVVA